MKSFTCGKARVSTNWNCHVRNIVIALCALLRVSLPQARIILAHAGGFLPYASHSFAELARVFRTDAADPAAILATFRRFYFDTALSSSPAALPPLDPTPAGVHGRSAFQTCDFLALNGSFRSMGSRLRAESGHTPERR